MKTNLSKLSRVILSCMFLILLTSNVRSQTNTYNVYLKNITFTTCRNLEFEIWLEWTGTNTQKFQFFQAGINFNYAGLANGGTMTGSFVAGTADASLPAVQQAPNCNVNASSKQFRILAAIATPSSLAAVTPPPPGFRLGKFRITNTADFTSLATPNFGWSFVTGTSSTTQSKIAFYLGGATTGVDVTVQAAHFIENNPAFNLTCGVVCDVTAAVDLNTAPACLGGTNGSARVTLSGTGLPATGTYSLDGGAATPYSTNPFIIEGLSAGPHSVTAITATPCTSNTAQFTIAAGADPNDGNGCTVDVCNSVTGVSNTPVVIDDGNLCTTDACNTLTGDITHLPFNVDDGNACTTDGCDSNTGVFHTPVVTDDGNACTTDACNTLTGAITNIAVNINDNNACTTDACNTLTGAITNTPVNVNDNNACTVDACNTLTGAITNTAVNFNDNNACTTDGCNTLTGVFNTPVNFNDNNACTTDGCNTLTGVFNTPINFNDGNACTTDGCNTLTGVFNTPVNVNDNNACTLDACNTLTGAVTNTAINFNDNNACTTDGCNTLTGVFNNPVNVNDGNACTTDACNTLTGAITNTPVNVNDNNACTTDACNTLTGAVTNTPVNINDNNACTTDGCNTLTGVFNTPVNFNDGNACTTDACNTLTGAITNIPVNVNDGNACTTDACNTLTGAITNTAIDFNDNNACTTDGCNTLTGVFNTPVNVNDGNACTTDACNTLTGAITNTPVNVNDNNACTTDACNTLTGAITNTPVNVNDNNACTTDGCNTLTGVFNTPVNFDDGNACTTDGCNTLTGVFNTPVNIDDGDICTEDGCNTLTGVFHNQIPGCSNVCLNPPTANANGPYSSCGNTLLNGSVGGSATGGTWSSTTGGTFIPAATVLNATYVPSAADLSNGSVTLTLTSNNPVGAPCSSAVSTTVISFISLDDQNACTVDGCNSITGEITHTPVVIWDNNACTTDACNPVTGAITHTPVNPNDNNPCTFDGCNTATGPFNIPINPDDGNACTTDGCSPTAGGIFHIPVDINDNDPCTYDACNSITGAISHTDDTPVVTATPGSIACYGENTCVTVTAVGGLPPYIGSGTQCGYPAGIFTFDVTDSRGCTGTSQATTINEPEKLTVSSSSTSSDCAVNNGSATAFPLGGIPGYSYLWSPGGQTTNPATGLGAGNYVVLVTDANGCTASQPTIVTSSGITPVPPAFISGPDGVCKKQTGIVYCVSPTPGGVYTWTLPRGITATGATNGPCITVKVSTKFKGGFICAKVTNACGTSGTSCKNVVMLKKGPKPPLTINGSVSLCPSSTGTYSVNPVAGASGYTWSGTGGLQIISGQGTTLVIVSAPSGFKGGDLKVKASSCAGKGGDKVLKLITKPANPGPMQGLGVVCKSINQSYNINSVNGALSYVWTATNGATIISGQGTNSVVVRFANATQNTTLLSVYAVNNCGNSNTKTKNISINTTCRNAADVLGSEEDNSIKLSELNAYPNPSSGRITLSFNSTMNAKYSIRVIDIIGKIMINENVSALKGFNSKEINLENLAKGVYLISVQTAGEQTKTLRIIIE